MNKLSLRSLAFVVAATLSLFNVLADIQPGETALVSRNADGQIGNSNSIYPKISGDGRYVVFASIATNLDGDIGGYQQLFRKDLQTGQVKMVSRGIDGVPMNDQVHDLSISYDGRYVSWATRATNLVTGNTGGYAQLYVRDMETNQVTCASRRSDGAMGNDTSGTAGSVSADGRYVFFSSWASNLVPDDHNAKLDIFGKDLQSGEIVLISRNSVGDQGNDSSGELSVSDDGRFIAFTSLATNYEAVHANSSRNIFVKNLQTGNVQTINTSQGGDLANDRSDYPQISRDGRFVAFRSMASNLVVNDNNGTVDAFVKDLLTGEVKLVTTTSDGSHPPHDQIMVRQISGSGRYVLFESNTSGLVDGDKAGLDVFLKDTELGHLSLVSVSTSGVKQNKDTWGCRMSHDARFVAFATYATNLTPGANSGSSHVYVRNTGLGEVTRTFISLSAPTSYVGKTTTFSARLREKDDLQPVAGQPLKFFLDGNLLGEVVTDAEGKAKLAYAIPESISLGHHRIQVRHPGNATYGVSSNSKSFEIQPGPVRLQVPSKTTTVGASLSLHAKLSNASGEPLAGRTLTFLLDGSLVGIAVTGSNGVAAKPLRAPGLRGTYTITVEFGGEEKYDVGSRTGTLTVN